MHIPTKRFSLATSTLDWEPTQETTLQILGRLAYGQPTYLSHRGSSIIDLFMSNTELIEPSMTIHHDLSLDSNHKLVSFSFQATADVSRLTRHPRYTWHLGKLRDPNKCKTYVERFRELSESLLHFDGTHIPLTDPLAAIAYIEQFNNDLCQAIYTALDETCDRVTNPGDPIRNRKWRKAQGLNKLHYWLQHQEARATVRRLITQRRRATWKDFCKRLASCDYTKAISKISRIRKNRTLKPTFSTPEGPQHAADTMASHLETIFSGAHQRTAQCNEITTPALPFAVECPITTDDISSAIRSLPPLLLHLFQLNWAWSYVPQPWRVAQVVPIHKKGSPSDPGNYRPISLTTIFRKILERCIQHTLRSEGPPLDIAQGGFRESRNALDQAIWLSELCQILRSQFRITPVLAFQDIKSAYDTINRNFIWKTLSYS
ncbi:hypothetical protein G6F51_011573 [Rhizopus arrhizus]|uniref:Reverse transcriptase domain-containing protein n=1 Tax=Rhizopus oryzae TaxID=64495 RepID=A0A9P6XZH4_RHIOR|nr:hypothetical protein G6F51_011573 [Rhizopus arrhizus]